MSCPKVGKAPLVTVKVSLLISSVLLLWFVFICFNLCFKSDSGESVSILPFYMLIWMMLRYRLFGWTIRPLQGVSVGRGFSLPSCLYPLLTQTLFLTIFFMSTNTVFTPNPASHGQAYQKLAASNPYANVEYRKSPWQKFLSRLGFRTNYDAYMESMALQAKEYDNALLQKEYDEQYNSPLAQAQRESEAGLNPNLTGNISSGEAAPLRDDGNPPVAPENDTDQIVNFASSVLSGVQMAFGLFGDIASLRSVSLANKGKQIQNNVDFMNFTKDALLNVLPEVYDDKNGLDWQRVDNYYNSFKSAYGNTMSKKQFRRFVQQASVFQQGLGMSEKEYASRSKRASDRKSFFQTVSGSASYSEVDSVMREISGELSDLATKVFKEESEANRLKSLNEQDYQNMVRPQENQNLMEYAKGFSGKERAALEKQSANLDVGIQDNQKKLSDYQVLLKDSFTSIMSKLKEMSDKGNAFASIAQAVLSAYLMGMLPSVSSSNKVSMSPRGSVTKSSSFSLK